MTRALYYKPSWEKLADRIGKIAPDLDVILLDEKGSLSRQGSAVTLEECDPEWFWIHGELMGNKALLPAYFDMITSSPAAAWLHTINTGLDVLPYDQVMEKGISISNNHSQAIAIAEYVLGQVMAHYQQQAVMQQQQRDGVWKYTRFRELGDTRWLVIGFGHIGQEIAVRARAFGVSIDAVRRRPDNAGLAEHVYTLDTMQQALAEADVVVLACDANASTRNLVDADFLRGMKPRSVLVNIARGDLVDETALLAALDQGQPGKAILDVFREEPLPADSPFWAHPSVVVTPHCSNAGSGMLSRSERVFLENLRRQVAGEPLLNSVSSVDHG